MILIVGLGNPGEKYLKTRHNIGFQAIDLISKIFNAELQFDQKFNSEISKPLNIDSILAQSKELQSNKLNLETQVILAKPQTFMNNSGEAIQKILHFYKIPPENCWVIFDELDLPLGKIKILTNGGPGTHNGMKSIVAGIGKNFPRFRIGIESRGVTAAKEQDTHSFVLDNFKKEEEKVSKDSLENIEKAVLTSLKNGLESGMNQFN